MNKYLPTVHGFDEFFGNLYHLNADEEPEHVDYPSEEEVLTFGSSSGPRGVLHAWATEEDDPTEQPRWDAWANRRLRTPARSLGNAWRRVTPSLWTQRRTSSSARMPTISRSLCG